MHSIDGIPMEDPNTIPDELEISDLAEGYLDRAIKLNTEAMGDRDQWDSHGNAVLDLVREMAGQIDSAVAAERERCAYIAETHTGLWDHATAVNIAASIRNPDHVA